MTDDIPSGVTAYLVGSDVSGNDGSGQPGDDEAVYPGDHLNPGDKVKIGNCREW